MGVAPAPAKDYRAQLTEVVQTRRRNLINHLSSYGYSRDFKEEMFQEAVLRAFRKIDTFDGRCSVYSWLLTILKNRVVDETRRPYLRRPHVEIDPEEEVFVQDADDQPASLWGFDLRDEIMKLSPVLRKEMLKRLNDDRVVGHKGKPVSHTNTERGRYKRAVLMIRLSLQDRGIYGR